MIINKFIVIYYLFILCSFSTAALGTVVGLNTIIRWRSSITSETRNQLENMLYLSRSAMFLGACIRLVMIPLWFYMLQSLIPLIPGAMCLAGIHQAVPIYSWSASSMKLILPLFYFTWIVIIIVDRKIIEQPFLKFTYYSLIPLIILIFTETFLDLKFLLSLKPLNVTCCTAMFDYSESVTSRIITESHWYFVMLFGVTLAVTTTLLILFIKRKTAHLIIGVCSVLLFIMLLLSLHTKLSPMILDAPFHHCVFCLLQINMFSLAGSSFLLLAIYLSFSFGLIAFLGSNNETREKIDGYLEKIRLFSLVLYFIGFILLSIPTLYSLIQIQGDI